MNNKVKRFIGYLLYIVAFGYIVIKAEDYQRYLKQLWSTTFDCTNLWLFMSIFPILVGLLLTLPHFIRTSRQEGSWKIDWIMLVAAGLPALCIAITPITLTIDVTQQGKIWSFIASILPYTNLVNISGIVFGFVLVTAFGKQDLE